MEKIEKNINLEFFTNRSEFNFENIDGTYGWGGLAKDLDVMNVEEIPEKLILVKTKTKRDETGKETEVIVEKRTRFGTFMNAKRELWKTILKCVFYQHCVRGSETFWKEISEAEWAEMGAATLSESFYYEGTEIPVTDTFTGMERYEIICMVEDATWYHDVFGALTVDSKAFFDFVVSFNENPHDYLLPEIPICLCLDADAECFGVMEPILKEYKEGTLYFLGETIYREEDGKQYRLFRGNEVLYTEITGDAFYRILREEKEGVTRTWEFTDKKEYTKEEIYSWTFDKLNVIAVEMIKENEKPSGVTIGKRYYACTPVYRPKRNTDTGNYEFNIHTGNTETTGGEWIEVKNEASASTYGDKITYKYGYVADGEYRISDEMPTGVESEKLLYLTAKLPSRLDEFARTLSVDDDGIKQETVITDIGEDGKFYMEFPYNTFRVDSSNGTHSEISRMVLFGISYEESGTSESVAFEINGRQTFTVEEIDYTDTVKIYEDGSVVGSVSNPSALLVEYVVDKKEGEAVKETATSGLHFNESLPISIKEGTYAKITEADGTLVREEMKYRLLSLENVSDTTVDYYIGDNPENSIEVPYTKDDAFWGGLDRSEVIDAYISRGITNSSFERHSILMEIGSISEMEKYRNNYFNI